MSEERFIYGSNEYWVKDKENNVELLPIDVLILLNEQEQKIQKLESENDDLRTTITKQVEAITEMKGIIYMLQDVYVIGEYSSEIEEDMVELQKAYDGTLEDFLNYFKED